jgi:hypothetical protein
VINAVAATLQNSTGFPRLTLAGVVNCAGFQVKRYLMFA